MIDWQIVPRNGQTLRVKEQDTNTSVPLRFILVLLMKLS